MISNLGIPLPSEFSFSFPFHLCSLSTFPALPPRRRRDSSQTRFISGPVQGRITNLPIGIAEGCEAEWIMKL
ncbi:hypothetical protein IEQ34_015000 [Dendrobium chrysotoxum]|uniref:Uncharacterized protein n=1 Tax=Dendrobium chrysotoxum TaxID=161865 RepID=A0AAV7GN13_DENCH|nr:hypothetical protein IEQ34_015000 [Dendrobium chrysotoxum]